jgi:hypothetical protein
VAVQSVLTTSQFKLLILFLLDTWSQVNVVMSKWSIPVFSRKQYASGITIFPAYVSAIHVSQELTKA